MLLLLKLKLFVLKLVESTSYEASCVSSYQKKQILEIKAHSD